MKLKKNPILFICSATITAFMFICYLYMLIQSRASESIVFLYAIVLFGTLTIIIDLKGDKNEKDNSKIED